MSIKWVSLERAHPDKKNKNKTKTHPILLLLFLSVTSLIPLKETGK